MSLATVLEKKKQGRKITMLTAYDYSMARLLEKAGVDVVLVGDSLANVFAGLDSTTQVGMAEMLYHAKAVLRGAEKIPVVVDMPFDAYQVPGADFVSNARQLMDIGCSAVKVEWFDRCADVVRLLVNAGVPVIGHVGLTPQTAQQDGGFKVRGKDEVSAARIMEQSVLLERQGIIALVLECVPESLAREITAKLKIPTIGIGAGVHCDGQVLVLNDMLGLYDRKTPKFVKRFACLGEEVVQALKQYTLEVERGVFPADEHTFH